MGYLRYLIHICTIYEIHLKENIGSLPLLQKYANRLRKINILSQDNTESPVKIKVYCSQCNKITWNYEESYITHVH